MDTALFREANSDSPKHVYLQLLKILIITYGSIWVIGKLVLTFWVQEHEITSTPYHGQPAILFVIGFFVFFLPLLYLFNCMLAKSWLKPEWRTLAMYMGLVFVCGCTIEIITDSAFVALIDRPAWLYQIWPVHNGYTSGATAVIWPMYAFYLYFFHQAMLKRGSPLMNSIPAKGVLMAVDAMALETLANTFSLVTMKTYYFYYFQTDLHHFTTIEIFIPYVLAGLFGMTVLKALDKPHMPKARIGLAAYIAGLILVFGV